MNEITEFNFDGRNVRTVINGNEPWFVAKDVCDILEVKNSRQALKHLDNDEKSSVTLNDGTDGNPNKSVVNESGMYALVMRSRKPEAKKFRKWVTSEVLPSIRKHGAYMTDTTLEKVLADPDLLIGLAQNLKAEKKRRIYAEKTKQCISDKKTATSMGRLSGALKQKEILNKKVELLEDKNKSIFRDFSRVSKLRKISGEIRAEFVGFGKHDKSQICSYCNKIILPRKVGRGIPPKNGEKKWTYTVHDACFEKYVLRNAEIKLRQDSRVITRKGK